MTGFTSKACRLIVFGPLQETANLFELCNLFAVFSTKIVRWFTNPTEAVERMCLTAEFPYIITGNVLSIGRPNTCYLNIEYIFPFPKNKTYREPSRESLG